MDVQHRERLRLTGDIEIGWPGGSLRCSAIEILHEDDAWTTRWDAPLSELRKLAGVTPAFGEVLALVGTSPDGAAANVTATAPPDLTRELDAAVAGLAPTEWMDHEPVVALLFRLDRWMPRSVGIVQSSG